MGFLQPPQEVCCAAELTLPLKLLIFNISFKTGKKKPKPLLLVLPSKDLEAGIFIFFSLQHLFTYLKPITSPSTSYFLSQQAYNIVSVSPHSDSFSLPNSLHFYCSALNRLTLFELHLTYPSLLWISLQKIIMFYLTSVLQ